MESLHGGTHQMNRLNYAHVVLIPKKTETRNVGDFRPITVRMNASLSA